jgi:urease accessory protein
MAITMTDMQTLIRLQTWLSPAFPTGAFSYSHGLEQAIAGRLVSDQESLSKWLTALLQNGQGWNDALLLAQSWRLSDAKNDLCDVAELAEAMATSKERHLETMSQGAAFVKAASVWGDAKNLPASCALPVAVGSIAATHGIDLVATLTAYLHAYVSNQIQSSLRLMKLGQQGGVEVLAALEPVILELAEKTSKASLDDLGSSGFMADICSMQHEHLETRIFRS